MRRHFFLALGLVAYGGGCAAATTTTATTATTESAAPRAVRANPNEITRAQIEANGSDNVYDLIMVLNPMWLQIRGHRDLSMTHIQVYVDNAHFGVVEDLRRIRTFNVRLIRRLDANGAQNRYGVGHAQGVIDIYLFTQ